MHKGPCGLELCALKNAEWVPRQGRKAAETEKRQTNAVHVPEQQMLTDTRKAQGGSNAHQQQKKRKSSFRHPDEPVPSALKRRLVVYDEEDTADDQFDPNDQTCFFWYHGRCSRSLDPRNNYHCDLKHALSNPPSIVEPPPGYLHSKPCGLEWCPGDAKDTISSRKGKSNGDVAIIPKQYKELQRPEPPKPTRKKPKTNDQANTSKGTCFFWYHGTCKRGIGPGEWPCPMRHEMRDPPKIVQPPPGYVHRDPCERKWCPGDARAVMEGDGCDKRYFEGIGVGGEESGDEEDGREQNWYLTGFGGVMKGYEGL